MSATSLAELRDVAIGHEPDRYFAATLAPGAVRYDLIVLAAFAAELARISSVVREPLAGEIRLQWWRDALASTSDDGAAGHPVAMAMRETMARFALPWEVVEGIIDAQVDVVYGAPPDDEAALRRHMAAWEGGLFRLAAKLCGNRDDAEMQRISASAGFAYGLSRVLTRISLDGGGWLPIPRSLLPETERDQDAQPEARDDLALRSALGTLTALAREAKAQAIAELQPLSRGQRIAFLPLAMVRPNLGALQTWLSRPDARATEPLPISRLLRIGWAHMSGRL